MFQAFSGLVKHLISAGKSEQARKLVVHRLVMMKSLRGERPSSAARDKEPKNKHALPLLVIRGKLDEVIPYEHGKTLFDNYAGPKKGVFPREATHNLYDVYSVRPSLAAFVCVQRAP